MPEAVRVLGTAPRRYAPEASLSRAEARDALGDFWEEEQWAALDKDGDGSISVEELSAKVKQRGRRAEARRPFATRRLGPRRGAAARARGAGTSASAPPSRRPRRTRGRAESCLCWF